jgi:hypothetical protein
LSKELKALERMREEVRSHKIAKKIEVGITHHFITIFDFAS